MPLRLARSVTDIHMTSWQAWASLGVARRMDGVVIAPCSGSPSDLSSPFKTMLPNGVVTGDG